MMYQQIHDIGSKYHSFKTDIWLQHDLFSLGWWSIVIDGVIPLN
ncbi:hypothetical protein P9D43_11220 [Neobacillus niacini]|nr:hypothetical protein [Neobacillus niacini]MEC1522582.1 hypothetical protein [Neobacillus niacini]